MDEQRISPEVARFLTEHISSVAQLELLLLLRTTAGKNWTVEDLTRELRVEAPWARAQLSVLCDHHLIHCSGESEPVYSYAPQPSELANLVTLVAQAYLLHRVSVIEAIYGSPNASIRAFSDAFRFRREPPNG